MPDHRRLAILTRLRKVAGVNLAQMAMLTRWRPAFSH